MRTFDPGIACNIPTYTHIAIANLNSHQQSVALLAALTPLLLANYTFNDGYEMCIFIASVHDKQ